MMSDMSKHYLIKLIKFQRDYEISCQNRYILQKNLK